MEEAGYGLSLGDSSAQAAGAFRAARQRVAAPTEGAKLSRIVGTLDQIMGTAERVTVQLGDFLDRCDGPRPEAVGGGNSREVAGTAGIIGAIEQRLDRLQEVLLIAEQRSSRLPDIG